MAKTIYFAGGCFWGVQKYFDSLDAVEASYTGYANANPSIGKNAVSYQEVCTGKTDAVEAVQVHYDPQLITLEELLDCFFAIIDPTTLNRQGPDVGTQYRSGIYLPRADYEIESIIISTKLEALQEKYQAPLVVENLPCTYFCRAEDYHQKYLENRPDGYCHLDLNDYSELLASYNKLAQERRNKK